MQYVASAAKRHRPPTARERLDRLHEWSRRPMSGRAAVLVPAAAGFAAFWMYVAITLLA